MLCQLKQEVLGEAREVAADLLVQAPRRDAIQLGKIGVQEHLLAANQHDPARDALGWHECLALPGHGGCSYLSDSRARARSRSLVSRGAVRRGRSIDTFDPDGPFHFALVDGSLAEPRESSRRTFGHLPAVRTAAADGGFTYVWLLVAVALLAAGLAAIGEVAATAAKREREAELLFVGDQFARAIAEYRASSPGAPQYPQKLEELLADKRYPNVRRYLRRVYPDPMTGRADWGLVRGPGGGIMGVYSQSMERPLKTANFPREYESFTAAGTYSAWRFVPVLGGPPIKPESPASAAAPGLKSGAAKPSQPAMPSSR
jgi:type II secretory pathway pseudopilin PulG